MAVIGAEESFAQTACGACERLGARVAIAGAAVAEEAEVDAQISSACAQLGEVDMLLLDGAGAFAAGGLSACLDVAWNATRALVDNCFLPAARAGRIVYLAPAPDAGEGAEGARAGLENLARTLSIEWARHRITLVTIAPDTGASQQALAALIAYLASPAGAYFSGCQLQMRRT